MFHLGNTDQTASPHHSQSTSADLCTTLHQLHAQHLGEHDLPEEPPSWVWNHDTLFVNVGGENQDIFEVESLRFGGTNEIEQ